MNGAALHNIFIKYIYLHLIAISFIHVYQLQRPSVERPECFCSRQEHHLKKSKDENSHFNLEKNNSLSYGKITYALRPSSVQGIGRIRGNVWNRQSSSGIWISLHNRTSLLFRLATFTIFVTKITQMDVAK